MSRTSCSTWRERTRSRASWSANSIISATSRSTFLAVAGAHRFILASSFLAIAVIMTLSYLLNLPASTRLSISAAEQKQIHPAHTSPHDNLERLARLIATYVKNTTETDFYADKQKQDAVI